MDFVVEKARAKTNLVLDILGKRPDGYHNLGTFFQTLEIFEEVRLTRMPSGGIQLENDPNVAHRLEDNLLHKAARFMEKYLNRDIHVRVDCEKSLPMGAGLGGGSADAAAVIRGILKLYPTDLNLKKLVLASAELGADVPFMIEGGSQWAEGIGEKLTPAQLPEEWANQVVLVLTPHCFVSTQEAYARVSPQGSSHFNRVRSLIHRGECSFDLIYNEFEKSVFPQFPEIVKEVERLYQTGANKVFLSGSGASLIALYDPDKMASELRVQAEQWGRFCAWTRFDSRVEKI